MTLEELNKHACKKIETRGLYCNLIEGAESWENIVIHVYRNNHISAVYYSDGKEEVNREVFFENLFENLYLLSNEKAEE